MRMKEEVNYFKDTDYTNEITRLEQLSGKQIDR